MPYYKVIKPITENGTSYQKGDIIKLTPERALQLAEQVIEWLGKDKLIEHNKTDDEKHVGIIHRTKPLLPKHTKPKKKKIKNIIPRVITLFLFQILFLNNWLFAQGFDTPDIRYYDNQWWGMNSFNNGISTQLSTNISSDFVVDINSYGGTIFTQYFEMMPGFTQSFIMNNNKLNSNSFMIMGITGGDILPDGSNGYPILTSTITQTNRAVFNITNFSTYNFFRGVLIIKFWIFN